MARGRIVGIFLIVGALASATNAAAQPALEIASVGSREQLGDEDSHSPAITADGRYVFFFSSATNFARKSHSIFRRDLETGRTRLVSRTSRGVAIGGATSPAVSPNGRFLAFCSGNPNVVKPDELFVSDGNGGLQYVDVFVRDLRAGITRRASSDFRGGMSNHYSCFPAVSNRGDVVFDSKASDLVRGDTNDEDDIFLWRWRTGKTRRVSVSSDGDQANGESSYPSISGNGRVIGFESGATNLVSSDDWSRPRYLHLSRSRRTVVLPAVPAAVDWCTIGDDAISRDGRYIAVLCLFSYREADGTLGFDWFLYRYDRDTRTYELASQAADGRPAADALLETHISAAGRYMSFCTTSLMLSEDENHYEDAYVRDLREGATTRLSAGREYGAHYQCETAVASTGAGVFASHLAFLSVDQNDALDVYVAK